MIFLGFASIAMIRHRFFRLLSAITIRGTFTDDANRRQGVAPVQSQCNRIGGLLTGLQ